MLDTEVDHLAFSILHGTFNLNLPGGCSCEDCQRILRRINLMQKEEAAKFYEEHYPHPGRLL